MAKQDKGVVKRAIVTPDKHFPYEDKPAINCLNKAIEIVKPDVYIDLGDVGEWESFSHWKWKRKKKPPLEYILPTLEKDVRDVTGVSKGEMPSSELHKSILESDENIQTDNEK